MTDNDGLIGHPTQSYPSSFGQVVSIDSLGFFDEFGVVFIENYPTKVIPVLATDEPCQDI